MIVTYRVLHPVDGMFVVIKVNIIAILKSSNRDHSIIALVLWVQRNAIDDAVSHNHQERIFNWQKERSAKVSQNIFTTALFTLKLYIIIGKLLLWNHICCQIFI